MNEERMICKKEMKIIEITDVDGDHIRDEFIEGEWEPIEPAPPENWMPFCSTFCNVDFEKKKCSGTVVDGVLIDSCLECPYRKME